MKYLIEETTQINLKIGDYFTLVNSELPVIPEYLNTEEFIELPSYIDLIDTIYPKDEGVFQCSFKLRAVQIGKGVIKVGYTNNDIDEKLFDKNIIVNIE